MTMHDWRRYSELPILIPGTDYRHAWDVFDAEDERGCLANAGDEQVRDALASVQKGDVVNLTLPLNAFQPPLFARAAYRHDIFWPARDSADDILDRFSLQGSTHWDGFRHVRAREFGHFGGYLGDLTDGTHLGVQAFAEKGIIGRGVLLDFSTDEVRSQIPGAITAADLEAAVERAGTTIQRGDILCICTGWMGDYRAADPAGRETMALNRTWPGLDGSADVAELLWDWRVAAVAADNPAVEISPGDAARGSLHRRVVPLLGIPLGELFTFEALAEATARHGRHTFAFVSVPLNLPAGVGSPANALALF